MARYQKEGPDKKGNYKIRDTERDALVKDSKGRVINRYEHVADDIMERLEKKPFEGIYEDNPKYGGNE